MSTGQSTVALWGRLGGKSRYGSFHLWINVWVAGKLYDPPLTHAIHDRLRDEILVIKRYTNLRLLYVLLYPVGGELIGVSSICLALEYYSP